MIVAIWHLEDFFVDLALFCYLHDLFQWCIWVAVTKVELDSVIEQDSILGDHADVLSETCKLQVFDILTINKYLTIFWVVNAEK